MLMFIIAPITVAKVWNQHKCPSMEEWIKEMWYIYMTKIHCVIKKKEILSFGIVWMKLEDIMFNEINWAQKNTE
jgi:hypothetical protein